MVSEPEEIRNLLEEYEKTESIIRQQVIDMAFFTKGGIDWNHGWHMSHSDREAVIKQITKHMKEMSGDNREWL